MNLIADFLLTNKLDTKPLYLHGASSGATFALKLPRELQARTADLLRCGDDARLPAQSVHALRGLRAARRRLRQDAADGGSSGSGSGNGSGLSSGISCKLLPNYELPPAWKMQLIARQLRGIISSVCRGAGAGGCCCCCTHAGMVVAWLRGAGGGRSLRSGPQSCSLTPTSPRPRPFPTTAANSCVNSGAQQLGHLPA